MPRGGGECVIIVNIIVVVLFYFSFHLLSECNPSFQKHKFETVHHPVFFSNVQVISMRIEDAEAPCLRGIA